MAWFNFGRDDLGEQLRTALSALQRIEGTQMSQNEELASIHGLLTEAGTEIPAKLDELLAQVESGGVDPNLVAEIKAQARKLADIVPNAPAETETDETDTETPPEPTESETPAQEAPVDEASTPE